MKNSLLTVSLLSFFLFLCPASVIAQRGHNVRPSHNEVNRPHSRTDFNPEKFRKDFELFIISRVNLTPQEQQRFFPLFHEMKKQQRDLRGKMHRATERACRQDLSERDSRRIFDEVMRLRAQGKELEESYYRRFQNVMPTSKLLRVMEAEHEFGKRMFGKKK